MKISSLNFRWIFVLMVAALFTSCDQDETTSLTENFATEAFNRLDREGKMGRKSCFDLVYPITLEFPDGTSAEADSKEAIRDLIVTWKEANPDATEKPNIQLPYDIELQDGSIATVNDEDELKELVGDCDKGPRGSKRKCYRLVVPVTIDFPDGTSTEYATLADLKDGLKTWKQENPDATERPSIAYPYDVELKDGSIVTVNNEEEEQALLDTCGDHLMKRRCFRPILPVTVSFPDGTSEEAETKEELRNLFKTWKQANPDATEHPTLAFPYEVTFKDGTTMTINNEADLETAKEACE